MEESYLLFVGMVFSFNGVVQVSYHQFFCGTDLVSPGPMERPDHQFYLRYILVMILESNGPLGPSCVTKAKVIKLDVLVVRRWLHGTYHFDIWRRGLWKGPIIESEP